MEQPIETPQHGNGLPVRESTLRLLDEMLGELTAAQAAGAACLLCGVGDGPHTPLIHPGTLAEVYSATGHLVVTCDDLLRCAVRTAADRRRLVDRARIARRVMLLVLVIGAVILLALVAGYAGRSTGPVDPGTPSTVTTIGGPR